MISFSDQLKGLTLEEVIPLNQELGRGAYGKVFKVNYHGMAYAAKEIHSLLVDGASPEEKKAIKDGFIRECYHSSLIRHPNIVKFKGVYYTDQSDLPIMVMELMMASINTFIQDNQFGQILMKTKVSILHDVSLGLVYLHGSSPVIVHRDLSSNNVLITSHLVAKISDLGMAKMIMADSKYSRSRLTTAPGTLHFMPPEALEEENPIYGTPVDVFSFAVVALHLFSEKWPTPARQVKKDPKTKKLMALTEAERRQQYLDKFKGGACVLKEIVERCLENDPDDRPSIQEVARFIKSLKVCMYM